MAHAGGEGKGEGKGFAGLSSLVSEVDAELPPPVEKAPSASASASASASSAGRPTPSPNAQSDRQAPPQQQPYQAPPPPTSGSPLAKWILGIAAVIGVLWLLNAPNKTTAVPGSGQTPVAHDTSPTYSPPPTVAEVPSRPGESKPPVGQDLLFTAAQIRYCVAETIRMDGAKGAVDNHSDSDVDRFNEMVADYNGRCGSFRYRSGALESARRDIEQYRSQLQTEGGLRFTRQAPPTLTSRQEASRPEPDATMQAIQRKLNELGYNAGSADGFSGAGTRAAIAAFQQERGLAITGVADDALLLQLQQTSSRPASANLPLETSVQLSAAEETSLEAACSTDKYVNGPSAYRACVARQKAALAAGGRRPDLSSLSSAELQSIEAACSTDKYVNGPAAYNQCLARQLQAMADGRASRPDLSRLSSAEQQSIEAACSTDKYVNGPAAYNRCLGRQLAAMVGGAATRPDLSSLSSDERQSIEAACSADKYVKGPAAYNQCLNSQLAALNRQGSSRPDLSRLSADERVSIESVCLTDKYVNGPAAYNRCLSSQLNRVKN